MKGFNLSIATGGTKIILAVVAVRFINELPIAVECTRLETFTGHADLVSKGRFGRIIGLGKLQRRNGRINLQ